MQSRRKNGYLNPIQLKEVDCLSHLPGTYIDSVLIILYSSTYDGHFSSQDQGSSKSYIGYYASLSELGVFVLKIESVAVSFPDGANVIIGTSHFIKTVEDIYEALVTSVPGIKFGLAFCEASQDRLVRSDGTDDDLKKIAEENARKIGAGHSFIVVLGNAFPINVLNSIKQVQEVCTIHCATANPVDVLVAENEHGRGILGVIDGETPLGVEGKEQISARGDFLRQIGYKRG